MRIVHVISGLESENGGPTIALAGLCHALRRRACEVQVVSTWKFRSSFAVADTLRAGGVGVDLLGPTRRPFRSHRDLPATLEQRIAAADVVHIHAMWEEVEYRAAVIARRLGKPYVWTPHGMLDVFNMRRNRLFKRAVLAWRVRGALDGAAAIHAASAFERDQIARLRLRPPTAVIGFGVDAALFDPPLPRGAFRRSIGIETQTPMVLFLGRIQHGKGVDVLAGAFALLRTPGAVLVIAGPAEGALADAVRRDVAQAGLAGRVVFTGLLDRPRAIEALRDADVLAAPSAHENFGLSVAEALTLGTPVVVSDQVGLASVIREGDLGRVVPAQPQAIAGAVDALLSDRDALTAMGERAAAAGRDRFDWNRVGAEWERLYETLRQPNPEKR